MRASIIKYASLGWLIVIACGGQADPGTKADDARSDHDRRLSLGQGTMSGEVTDSSVLLQTRLTQGVELNRDGDLPGAAAVACFEWSAHDDFRNSKKSSFTASTAQRDYIVRHPVDGLQPGTKYFFRVIYGPTPAESKPGPTCSFSTLPGTGDGREVQFIVGSCMNYIKFMHGRAGNASGPLTATLEDKRLGFPAFEAMKRLGPDFFVGTGDIVYYDNRFRLSKTVPELRRCWHEQFRFPRMIDFFAQTPCYWSKDDHDFRYNDSDNQSDRRPLPRTGIGLFGEQLPIMAHDTPALVTYRTHRVSRDLQIWLTEGRDYRSPNEEVDGPNKTMWGITQREWLKKSLKSSDAKWKLLISPTPMVGPDDAYKIDNHASLDGFRFEANAFFDWVKENQIQNLFLICGDRHWQYHSIHPMGVHEFACGALNDENSRMGVAPGAKKGTDPEARVVQRFTSPQPSGGFLHITVGKELVTTHYDDQGTSLYRARFSGTRSDQPSDHGTDVQ